MVSYFNSFRTIIETYAQTRMKKTCLESLVRSININGYVFSVKEQHKVIEEWNIENGREGLVTSISFACGNHIPNHIIQRLCDRMIERFPSRIVERKKLKRLRR